MREIVVGDVHGCLDQLEELLSKVKFDKDSDKLIFVGDLVDRGLKIIETMNYVKALKEYMAGRLVYVIGNHEFMWGERDFRYGGIGYEQFFDWIMDNVVPHYKGKYFNVVHGGVYSECPEKERLNSLVWDREAFRYGYYGGKLTIVGHTPLNYPVLSGVNGLTALKYGKLYNANDMKGLLDIDTGCVFDGYLTAAVFNDDRFKLVKVEGENNGCT